MRQYWWVNHRQTVKHEVDGGYLWSPKIKKDGKSNKFWDNMRLAAPGDYVLSFASGKIGYLGQVVDFAFTSPMPDEFGLKGNVWGKDGWRLPIHWKTLQPPVLPRDHMTELADLLPSMHSPIRENGNGNQGAYLAKIDFSLFQAVMAKAGVDLDLVFATDEIASAFGSCSDELDDAVERQLTLSPALSATEKEQVIKARRGQGLFRQNVLQYEQSCRITGVTTKNLLIASHIKPWRSCETSHERLDGNNGFLLTPHVDLMFDRGLISFNDDGSLLVSTRMDPADLQKLGIRADALQSKSFNTVQRSYLGYHRVSVFIP